MSEHNIINKFINNLEKGKQYCSDYIINGKGNVIKLYVKNKTDNKLILVNKFNNEEIIHNTVNSLVKPHMVDINDIVYCFKCKFINNSYTRNNDGVFFNINNRQIKEAPLILIPNTKEYKICPKNIKQINYFDKLLDISLKMSIFLDDLEKQINNNEFELINLKINYNELKKKNDNLAEFRNTIYEENKYLIDDMKTRNL